MTELTENCGVALISDYGKQSAYECMNNRTKTAGFVKIATDGYTRYEVNEFQVPYNKHSMTTTVQNRREFVQNYN